MCGSLLSKSYWIDNEKLGHFVAHLNIIGGDKHVIEIVERLQKGLFNPIQYLEKALDATPDSTWSQCSDEAIV